MIVIVTLTSPGADTGPFNLFSNIDLINPLVTGVAKSLLVAGYTLNSVPDTATSIIVRSTGTCTNELSLTITTPTTTTTSTTLTSTTTTSTTAIPTTTTTTTSILYTQYTLCTDVNVKYYIVGTGVGSSATIAGDCYQIAGTTYTPEGTEFFTSSGACSCP
jgi:hypothetical protein